MNHLELHPAVATYFASTNARDPIAFASCFAPAPVVLDEGEEIHGLDAVLRWRERTTREYSFLAEPREVRNEGDRMVVKAFVTGDFPGNPIDLYYIFDLQNGLIARLETVDEWPDVR